MRTPGVRAGSAGRDALRVTVAGVCLLVQTVALFVLASDWVEASNASRDCGYDGTCVDRGLFGATVIVELVMIAAEFVAGAVLWGLPLWRLRRSPGVDDWWELFTLSLPGVVMAGCLLCALTAIGWGLLA